MSLKTATVESCFMRKRTANKIKIPIFCWSTEEISNFFAQHLKEVEN